MNKRLIVIIVAGATVIAATYVFTRPPEEVAPPATPLQTSVTRSTQPEAGATETQAEAGKTNSTDQAQTATPVQSTTEVTPNPATAPGVQTTVGDSSSESHSIIPSTHREAAKLLAKGSGTIDPFTTSLAYKPFPSSQAKAPETKDPAATSSSARTADPGKNSKPSHHKLAHHKIPPPPNGFIAPPPPAGSLDVSQLPEPPAPPTVADKLKVVGIIGDKAIVAVTDLAVRHEFKWSKMMTVGTGDILGPVTVIAVKSDSITLEEDGTRTEKELSPVR